MEEIICKKCHGFGEVIIHKEKTYICDECSGAGLKSLKRFISSNTLLH